MIPDARPIVGACVGASSVLAGDDGATIRGRFLVDTGAELSVLSLDVVDRLGLAPVDVVHITGVIDGAEAECPLYRVRLSLDHVATSVQIDVAGLVRDSATTDGLLGRDVLAHVRFSYDGPRGAFALDAALSSA